MAAVISRETIDAAKAQIDAVAVVGEYTKLSRRGGNDWWGCCPFHSEKSPSFHINGDTKFFYCFGCHESGDIISFVMKAEGLSYRDAVASVAKRAGVEMRYESGGDTERTRDDELRDALVDLYERVAQLFHYLLTQTEGGKGALAYAVSRGLTMETIEKFNIGWSPPDGKWLKNFLRKKNFTDDFLARSGLFSKKYPDVAFFRDRLMFPITNRQGKRVAFGGRLLHGDGPKYLNSGDMPQYKKGDALYAFSLAKRSIRETRQAILCEGYMDCIAYHQCGIPFAVAPLGTSLTEDQLKILRGLAETILLSFDSDGAGQNATVRAIYLCRRMGLTVKVIRLSGGKDPAEIMTQFGAEALTNAVKSATMDCDFLLSKLRGEYAVGSPEGKARAAFAFFPYVDSLQSDTEKELSLGALCDAFALPRASVERDFADREGARLRLQSFKQSRAQKSEGEARKSAELRCVLACVANLDTLGILKAELSADDFTEALPKKIFSALSSDFGGRPPSVQNILDSFGEKDRGVIERALASGEFSPQGENDGARLESARKAALSSAATIKRASTEREREGVVRSIAELPPGANDGGALAKLMERKKALDERVKELALLSSADNLSGK